MFILSWMGDLLMVAPWVAFIISGVFLGMWFKSRRRTLLVTGILWDLYGIYEFLMYFRILCSGECNIRIDLLLIYPLLLLLSLISLLLFIRHPSPRAANVKH